MFCSICFTKERRKGGRYCLPCHNNYVREWRKTQVLSDIQKFKAGSRAFANASKRRGFLTPEPCRVCRSENSEMHHEDYEKPLTVVWMCRPCHLDHHREERIAERQEVQQKMREILTRLKAA